MGQSKSSVASSGFAPADESVNLYYEILEPTVNTGGGNDLQRKRQQGNEEEDRGGGGEKKQLLNRVVLVSGSLSDTRRQSFIGEFFVSKGYQVLRYDHRGMGRSTMDTEQDHYKMATYANDLKKLLDHVGWGETPFHLIGISFGGMVSQEFLINFPDMPVKSAILACSPSKLPETSREIGLKAPEMTTYQFLSTWIRKTDSRFQYFPRNLIPPLAGFFGSIIPGIKHKDSKNRRVFWNVTRLYQLKARAEHDTLDRIDQIETPTLIAGGRFDTTCPVPDLEEMATKIKHSSIQFFHGGHIFYASNKALDAFSNFIAQYD